MQNEKYKMQNEINEESPYKVKLEVFEGPLDLLLHLIKENEIDIYDIPIALITQQYLEYLDLMKELNIELAGEFLVMAATLIHIKSKMLLPPSEDETEVEEEIEDPRAELVQRLLEYKRFKEAAEELALRETEWRDVFPRQPVKPESLIGEEEPILSDISLFDLLSALRRVLERVPEKAFYEVTREELSLKEKISMLLERLESKEGLTFDELFSQDTTKAEVIVTFLALLEVIRLRLVRIFQSEDFGVIRMSRAGL
jgi:segregation and condensation protein A